MIWMRRATIVLLLLCDSYFIASIVRMSGGLCEFSEIIPRYANQGYEHATPVAMDFRCWLECEVLQCPLYHRDQGISGSGSD